MRSGRRKLGYEEIMSGIWSPEDGPSLCVPYISKAVPLRHAGAKEERTYSSYSLFTEALDGVCGQRHARPRFIPGRGSPIPIR
jgi:hypothetical protein